jgi:hypothetical protein
MKMIANMSSIYEVLNGWRALGSLKFRSGVELLGLQPQADRDYWMHVIFPGWSREVLTETESLLGMTMPSWLRSFYRHCGGMSLFSGAFLLHGRAAPGYMVGDDALQPADLLQLNREIGIMGWLPEDSVVFASNTWDLSVYVAVRAASGSSASILRCERRVGAVLEVHDDLIEFLDSKLNRLDRLQV